MQSNSSLRAVRKPLNLRLAAIAVALACAAGGLAGCGDDDPSPPTSTADGGGSAGRGGSSAGRGGSSGGGSGGSSGSGGSAAGSGGSSDSSAGPGGSAGSADSSAGTGGSSGTDGSAGSTGSGGTPSDAGDGSAGTGGANDAGDGSTPDARDAGSDAASDARPDSAGDAGQDGGTAACAPGTPAPGGVLQGSFTVANQIDVQNLAAYSEVTGDLTISNGLINVVLPNLVRVGGAINLQNTATVRELGLPALATVGGHMMLERNQGLEQVRLCSLRQVGGFHLSENPKVITIDFPRLETAPYFNFGINVALTRVTAPVLVTAPISMHGSPLITSYALPSLRNVRWIALSNMPALTALNLSQITAIEIGFSVERTGITVLEGSFSSPLDVTISENPALERVSFPNVQEIWSLQTNNNPKLASVDFRSATRAVTRINIATAPAGQVRLDALATAETVSVTQAATVNLSSLRATTDLSLSVTQVTNIALPELTSVGDPLAMVGNFAITSNSELLTLSAPKLRTVGNYFAISLNPKLPNCRALAILGQLTNRPPLVNTNGNDASGVCN